jgi:uncharacterized protein (TIGR02147 family)
MKRQFPPRKKPWSRLTAIFSKFDNPFALSDLKQAGKFFNARSGEHLYSLKLDFGKGGCISSPMLYETQDYRLFLKTTFAEKNKGHSNYSLRAFAQKLNISNSFLSEVFSSKKSLSVEQAFKIAVKLELTDTETQYLCLLVQLEHEEDPVFREELLKRLGALNPKLKPYDLSADLFKIIADWHHLAILELPTITGFKFNSATVAEKLGISKVEADLAIDRLLRLELLEKDKKGALRKTKDFVFTESLIPNEAFKQFHRQILEKAFESLKTQTPKERISATNLLAIDSKYLAEVDRLSREFSAAVLKLGDKSKVKNSMYALSTHFFKIGN